MTRNVASVSRLPWAPLVVLWLLGAGAADARKIHNNPELVRRFESITNSPEFRNRIMGMLDSSAEGSGMPRDGQEMFTLFHSLVSDAKSKVNDVERDYESKLEEHARTVQEQTTAHGYEHMRRKSGALLDLMSNPTQALDSHTSLSQSHRMLEQLSAGKDLDSDMVSAFADSAGVAKRSSVAQVVDGSAAGGAISIPVLDDKGHASHEVKALAGVPRIPHVHMKDAYQLAVASLPRDIHKEKAERRLGDKLQALRDMREHSDGDNDEDNGNENDGGGGGSGGSARGGAVFPPPPSVLAFDQQRAGGGGGGGGGGGRDSGEFADPGAAEDVPPPAADALPFGARAAANTLDALRTTTPFTGPTTSRALPRVEDDKELQEEVSKHEKAMRAVLGKQHSQLLERQEKEGHHLSALRMLNNMHDRLVDAKDDVMGETFERMNTRVQAWQDQGIENLKDVKRRSDGLITESHHKWKGVLLQNKLAKAQLRMRAREL